MQKFRVLYLRHNKLEHSESLTGLDLLEVIEKASKRVPDLSAEIWSERGRVGIVEPLPLTSEAPGQAMSDGSPE